MKRFIRARGEGSARLFAVVSVVALFGCAPLGAFAESFTIGGSISNLVGSGLVLQLDAPGACVATFNLTTEAGDRFYAYTDANKGSGRMAIVLPQGNLNNLNLSGLRDYLLARARLLAVVAPVSLVGALRQHRFWAAWHCATLRRFDAGAVYPRSSPD